MRKVLATISLVCLAGLAAACNTAPAPTFVQSTPAVSTLSPSAFPAVAKVTAACPLLSADELKTLLGGSASRTKLTAVEEKPDSYKGYISYTCDYDSNGKHAFSVGVQAIKQAGFTPAVSIDAIAKASKRATEPVADVGAAGVYYVTSSANAVVAAAKTSHGETRTVFVITPAIVPKKILATIAATVLTRV
jgi:hypothetical protein